MLIADLINGLILKLLDYIPVPSLFRKLFMGKSPVDRLYDILQNNYVTSEEELKYQMKCYVPQRFRTKSDEVFTAKELREQIKLSKSNLFTIVGKPASGKTTAMRYLYCSLINQKKCVYFQMKNVKDIHDLKKRLEDQKKDNAFKSRERVIAFFDGVDEAISFFKKEDFISMFLKGMDSKIILLFDECDLVLNCMVFGMRPEFLKNSVFDLEYKNENVSMRVFEIMEMSDKEIIKIFKSLKILKKMEKKLPEEERRHQFRYPPKKERKYIRLLKKILKSNPDSIFHYPMYIRYAYAYMQRYEKQWNPYMQDLVPDTDKASAFDVLVRAISKWEFHVYYKGFHEEDDRPWREFYGVMKKCIDDIIKVMTENGMEKVISRGQLQTILDRYCLGAVSGTETMMLVISHCFMISDKTGEKFEFCHLSFYEYFLARYLFEKADVTMRKQYLRSDEVTVDLRQMYYGVFRAEKKEFSEKVSKSISNFNGRKLTIENYTKLRENTFIEIVDNTMVPMAQIYEYLPEIRKFRYRGLDFHEERIEQMLISGIVNISDTGWDSLQYAGGLLDLKLVKELNLCGLRIKDPGVLKQYTSLKCLDIRDTGTDYFEYMQNLLPVIKDIPLECLSLYSEDGSLCEQISDMVEKGEFCEENIFWDMPDYSKAHLKIYQLKQKAEHAGRVLRFYANRRTCLQNAQLEYKKDNNKKDADILKAVFELEADEGGVLGLDKKDAEATFWTGLSLAEYYGYQDYADEAEKAYRIYCRLEPFIKKDGSELSAFYGKSFGENLRCIFQYERSREWFIYTDSILDHHYFSEKEEINIKLDLYRVQMNLDQKDFAELQTELEMRIKKIPNYQKDQRYMRYMKFKDVNMIRNWKKGEQVPQNLMEQHQEYLHASELYAKNAQNSYWLFIAVYYAVIIANRMENLEEGKILLKKLKDVMNIVNKHTNERKKQSNWIRYREQKLYHLFLAGQKEETIKAANELLESPRWPRSGRVSNYLYIRDACMQEKEEPMDKHKLWGVIWY